MGSKNPQLSQKETENSSVDGENVTVVKMHIQSLPLLQEVMARVKQDGPITMEDINPILERVENPDDKAHLITFCTRMVEQINETGEKPAFDFIDATVSDTPEIGVFDEALHNDDVETIKKMFETMPYLRNLTKENGTNVLMLATAMDRKNIAKWLVETGFNFNKCRYDGISSFHAAVVKLNYDLVELMLKNGCNPDTAFGAGSAILGFVKDHGYDQMAALLEQYGATGEPFFGEEYSRMDATITMLSDIGGTMN